jgi:hypothetical protein
MHASAVGRTERTGEVAEMIDETRREYYAGGLLMLIGAGTAYIGSGYQVGTLTRMGPGFFPTCLGVLLTFMGVLVTLASFSSQKSAAPPPIVDLMHATPAHPDWRGWSCIIGSVLAFIALSEYAGLLAATFFCVFIACLGDRTATLKGSVALSTGITIFGLLLFSYVLRVQIPVIRGL